ncbi:rRNA processing/ribosome biogenesis [Teratosphaeria destructans]|uniref:Pre-rRNA-processing protein RIX1 n=1 Tax=Teratosphaeria destructans TaxID=418781 RepID=A0A9W7SV14_9PEZI|nr:rRNA processing/ribosome biogenesis [Teratosphaeria destructans]
MSGADKEAVIANLRAITYRLSSTPSRHLPQVATQIAGQLWSCKDLLSTPSDSTQQSNDASVAVHRFKTQLSTLLQDRTIEGRWSAVVLVKSAIEAGGLEVVSKSHAWVRSLLAILKRPDPSSTRCLAIISLTRIFTLTWDHSNLVREITTPALPALIATCLSNVGNRRCDPKELQMVLEAFGTLVPRHPTIFRTNETQIRSLLGKVLSGTHGDHSTHYSEPARRTSQRLLVLLSQCSPKQGAAAKWDETLRTTVTAAHATCDRMMRSVVETWQSTADVRASVPHSVLYHGEVAGDGHESLGLSGWQGIFAGSERLTTLLDLVASHVLNATSGIVPLHLGLIADLLTRTLSVRARSGKHQGSQANNQIPKDERDALFSVLPRVHASALHLLCVLLRRFEHASMPILQPILTRVTWIFESEALNSTLRPVVYQTLALVLKVQGPHMSKDDIADIEPIARACCQDLLPSGDDMNTPIAQTNGIASKSSTIANGMIGQHAPTPLSRATQLSGLRKAAQALLPICLSSLNPAQVPSRSRTMLERTAILTQDKEALVAAVLYPAQNKRRAGTQRSLLPLLARQFPDSPEVEALLRPRMPIIRTGGMVHDDEAAESGYEVEDAIHAMEGIHETHGRASELVIASSTHQVEQYGDQESAITKVSEKRLTEQVGEDRSAKRLRASPSVQTATLPVESLPGADQDPVRSDITHTYAQPQSSFVTAPEPSQQAVASTVAPTIITAKQADDDDSDFEMPPLTMEQDTDPEDQDEDSV